MGCGSSKGPSSSSKRVSPTKKKMASGSADPATFTAIRSRSGGEGSASGAPGTPGASTPRSPGGHLLNIDALRAECITPGSVKALYSIGSILGRGAFSSVRLAQDRKTGERLALKIINRKQFAGDSRQLAIVLNEIAIMKRIAALKHPNVIKFVAAYEDSQHLYIALNVCDGGELFDRIVARGHYSESDASQLVRKLLDALKHLHDACILHRDMKPENCLFETVTDDAEVVITDFGLAHALDGPDVHSSLVGTPGYVAPEVLTSRGYSPACDIWAIGVILYILLVGYPPFYAETNPEMFEQIKAGSYAFHEDAWGEISEAAKDLVRRMLVVNPLMRISATEALEHPFIKEHQSVAPLHNIPQLKKFNARRKFKAAAMACVWGARMRRADTLSHLTASVTEFTKEEVSRLQAAFRKVAIDDSIVTGPQFEEVMARLGFGRLPLSRMFELFDIDGNGEVDYREFLCGLIVLKRQGEEAIEWCFRMYDQDGSGYITQEELAQVLGVIALDDEKTELEKAGKLATMFETLDTDMDGKISFEEFKAGCEKEPILTAAFLKPVQRVPSLDTSFSGSGGDPSEEDRGGSAAGAGGAAGGSAPSSGVVTPVASQPSASTTAMAGMEHLSPTTTSPSGVVVGEKRPRPADLLTP